MKFSNPFAPRRPASNTGAGNIRQWTREQLHLAEDAVVTVTEIRCRESGCPDLETVVSIFEASRPARSLRVGKATGKITQADITLALELEGRLPYGSSSLREGAEDTSVVKL